MIITLQVNAQVGDIGHYRNDNTHLRPIYRSNPDYNRTYSGSTHTYVRNIPVGNSYSTTRVYSNRLTSRPVYNYPAEIYRGSYYYPSDINYFVSTKSLNVRSGPSSDYQLIYTLPYGESVTVIESYSNGWKKVQYTYYDSYSYSTRTGTGFVAGNYLSISNPYSSYNSLNNYYTYNANVYSSISNKKVVSHSYVIGGVTIWTNCGTDGEIRVYLDDIYVGSLTQYFSDGLPKCGDSGTLFIEKPSGTYKLEAKGNHYSWKSTITIVGGKCLIQGLE